MGRLKSVAAVCISLLLCAAAFPPVTAYAAEGTTAFDRTAVEEDLREVDLTAYPADPEGEVGLVKTHGLIEYAFSVDPAIAGEYYGVYLYLYNPAQLAFERETVAATATVAVAYDGAGKPIDYARRELVLLDMSKDKRFLKCKFTGGAELYNRALTYAAAHDGERRYDVSDVTLTGRDGAKTYEIGATFVATGFSQGCAPDKNAPADLTIQATDLKVIPLDVYPTQYVTGADTAGAGKQYILSSVYFSVPQEYMQDYGALTFVKAEWYEYRTTPIFVTTSNEIYDTVESYLGYTLDGENGSIHDKNVPFYFVSDRRAGDSVNYGWDYNKECNRCEVPISRLDWLFRTNTFDEAIPRVEVQQWAASYRGAPFDETITVGGKEYNANLFAETVEEGHTKGYNEKTLDLRNEADYIDLKIKNTTSGWEKFLNMFRRDDRQYESFLTERAIPPIYPVEAEEAAAKDVADKLFVGDNAGEIYAFRQFVEAESKKKNQVFLLRFSVNEYETKELEYGLHSSLLGKTTTCYGAVAPIFLDFKIIYLGFWDTKNETIIPAVHTPIDIYPNITAPPSLTEDESRKWIAWVAIAGGICLAGLIVACIAERGEKL